MYKPTRIFLIDAHPLICEGLQAVLAQHLDLELVGQAATSAAAWSLLDATQPDVLLLEILTPGINSVLLIRLVRQTWPHMRVAILTSCSEPKSLRDAIQAGAVGYASKESPLGCLVKTLRAIHHGDVVIPAALLSNQALNSVPLPLTKREWAVLRLLAQGLRNDQIAQELVISRSTVGVHVSRLLAKLGLKHRTEAALFAQQQNWLEELQT